MSGRRGVITKSVLRCDSALISCMNAFGFAFGGGASRKSRTSGDSGGGDSGGGAVKGPTLSPKKIHS